MKSRLSTTSRCRTSRRASPLAALERAAAGRANASRCGLTCLSLLFHATNGARACAGVSAAHFVPHDVRAGFVAFNWRWIVAEVNVHQFLTGGMRALRCASRFLCGSVCNACAAVGQHDAEAVGEALWGALAETVAELNGESLWPHARSVLDRASLALGKDDDALFGALVEQELAVAEGPRSAEAAVAEAAARFGDGGQRAQAPPLSGRNERRDCSIFCSRRRHLRAETRLYRSQLSEL